MRVVDKPPSVGQSETSVEPPSGPAFGRAHGDAGPTGGSPDHALDVPVQRTTYVQGSWQSKKKIKKRDKNKSG